MRFRAHTDDAASAEPSSPPVQRASKKRQGTGPRLNDATRLEIIAMLQCPEPLSLRKIAKQFGVVEATIRHVRDHASVITSRALAVTHDVRLVTRRVVQRPVPALETELAMWLRSNALDPSCLDTRGCELATRHATELATSMALAPHEFSASKSWLAQFQRRQTVVATAVSSITAQPSPSPSAVDDTATAAVIPTTTTTTKRKRGAGPRLSDATRLEIIQQLEQRQQQQQQSQYPRSDAQLSNRQLAARYSVDEATIRHIQANAVAITQRAQSLPIDVRQTTFRAGRARFADLEAIVAEWIVASRRCREEIPPRVVRRRAEALAVELAIPPRDFQATLGWYRSFCRRRGLTAVAPTMDLAALVGRYDPHNVFSVDETGLFYALLPPSVHNVVASATVADNASPERVTLVVCCNATGTERLPVSVIAKAPLSATASGDAPTELELRWLTQRNAWMDAQVFAQWFDDVFAPFVASRQQRPQQKHQNATHASAVDVEDNDVLLLLDTAPGHPVSFTRRGIRVVAVHASSPNWSPPLEHGILQALKTRYKRNVLRGVLAFCVLPTTVRNELTADAFEESATAVQRPQQSTRGLFYGHAPHVRDAAAHIAAAWRTLPSALLRGAFVNAGVVPQLQATRDAAAAAAVEATEVALEQDMLVLLQRIVDNVERGECASGTTTTDAALANELETFLHVDDENSTFYHQCIIQEVDSDATSAVAVGDTSGSATGDGGATETTMPSTTATISMPNAMHHILNDSDATAPATVPQVPVVNVSSVCTQAALLGLQLRQLQATRTGDDGGAAAIAIQSAMHALDELRRELLIPVALTASVSAPLHSTATHPDDTIVAAQQPQPSLW